MVLGQMPGSSHFALMIPMYTVDDFDYILPPERIAQTPVEPRDLSKLLILDRESGAITDRHFRDLATELGTADVLVLNNTKVFPARLLVHKTDGPAAKPVEILLEKEVSLSTTTTTWEVLTKPGLRAGDTFQIPGSHVRGVCEHVNDYTRTVTFFLEREHFLSQLDRFARTPIPPYIRWNADDETTVRECYQTVFAKYTGAVAAPTAGLHFTPELLDALQNRGVTIAEVTLHVGLGTFLPVKTHSIIDHRMHAERFVLNSLTAQELTDAKKQGKRIIAVGTTVVRVLESCAANDGTLTATTGTTDIFLYPPYRMKFVDSILTNFHTPKSTLLMLVAAFTSSPNTSHSFSTFLHSSVGRAYSHALDHDYRFYSFGDAMWIR